MVGNNFVSSLALDCSAQGVGDNWFAQGAVRGSWFAQGVVRGSWLAQGVVRDNWVAWVGRDVCFARWVAEARDSYAAMWGVQAQGGRVVHCVNVPCLRWKGGHAWAVGVEEEGDCSETQEKGCCAQW